MLAEHSLTKGAGMGRSRVRLSCLVGVVTSVFLAPGLVASPLAAALTSHPTAADSGALWGPKPSRLATRRAVATVPAPTVSPTEVTAGGVVTVSGTQCTSTTGPPTVYASLVDSLGGLLASGGAAPKLTGAWQVRFTVPPSTKSGTYSVDSTCDQYNVLFSYPAVSLVVDSLTQTWGPQKTPTRLAPNGALRSVSCPASTACAGVGSYTNTGGSQAALAEEWNGTSWVVQSAANPAGGSSVSLSGVSCTASSACIAVGSYVNKLGKQAALAEEWNGTSWVVQSAANPAGGSSVSLSGVSCTASSARVSRSAPT